MQIFTRLPPEIRSFVSLASPFAKMFNWSVGKFDMPREMGVGKMGAGCWEFVGRGMIGIPARFAWQYAKSLKALPLPVSQTTQRNSCHLGGTTYHLPTTDAPKPPNRKGLCSLYGNSVINATQSASEEGTKRSKALMRHRKHVQIFQLILFFIFILFHYHAMQIITKKYTFIRIYTNNIVFDGDEPKKSLNAKNTDRPKRECLRQLSRLGSLEGKIFCFWTQKTEKGQAANHAVNFFFFVQSCLCLPVASHFFLASFAAFRTFAFWVVFV